MVNRNLLRLYDLPEDQLRRELDEVFGGDGEWFVEVGPRVEEHRLLTARVRHVSEAGVWVDLACKSEGVVELGEWYDESAGRIVPPRPGDEVPLLVQSLEDDSGALVLSYRKALGEMRWRDVLGRVKTGDVVRGPVTRKVKGGLLVDIGVNVFLPASQVDIRRPADVGEYIGRTIECKVLEVDEVRRNIIVSRRELLQQQREQMKQKLLAEIEVGQVRRGIVRNIAEYGVFVDLGGMDGLLHVNDMSWDRANNPHELARVGQEMSVYVLRVERDRQRIALSLKHTTPSPWASVADRYPLGSRHKGVVVNVMSYGAFVKLEPGIEGLVHISQMSASRIGHPSEMVAAGDPVEVQVLGIDAERKRIALGMKQANG